MVTGLRMRDLKENQRSVSSEIDPSTLSATWDDQQIYGPDCDWHTCPVNAPTWDQLDEITRLKLKKDRAAAKEAEDVARLRETVSADQARHQALSAELLSAKKQLSIAEMSAHDEEAPRKLHMHMEGIGGGFASHGHGNFDARDSLPEAIPEAKQQHTSPAGMAATPEMKRRPANAAATALQELAAEAEGLLGTTAQYTLREVTGPHDDSSFPSAALLLRSPSPVEHISSELQREAQALEALASK